MPPGYPAHTRRDEFRAARVEFRERRRAEWRDRRCFKDAIVLTIFGPDFLRASDRSAKKTSAENERQLFGLNCFLTLAVQSARAARSERTALTTP
jgi:hypothetical protein